MSERPIKISEDRPISVPLRTLIAAVVAIGTAAIGWAMMHADVQAHETRLAEQEKETRGMREIMIRVDTRTEEIDRRLQRAGL